MKLLKNKKILFIIALTIGMFFSHHIYGNANTIISQEEAESIALREVPGTVIRTELDTEDGIKYYEVYIQTSSGIAEVYINAQTSELIKIDFEHDASNNNNNNNNDSNNNDNSNDNSNNNSDTSTEIPRARSGNITLKDAEAIALEHVSGTVIHTSLDDNIFYIYALDGVLIREVYIHAQTGEVMTIDTNFIPLAGGVLVIALGFIWLFRKKILKKKKD